MDTKPFIETFIENINKIRNEDFEKNDFKYQEKVITKKSINENSTEFKSFKSTTRKKALLEKTKPGNIGKKEYENIDHGIDILQDDIFNDDSEPASEDSKLDIESLDRDKKLELINDFLQRKNIILDQENLKKIEMIVDDPEITLKKYLNISKIYQQVIKVGFIKKLENGSYIIDLNNNKTKKSKNYFVK
jgi:hypothetical protein